MVRRGKAGAVPVRIAVLGAGALGSLMGGLLAESNEVVLVGRRPHTAAVRRSGLRLVGATRRAVKVEAVERVDGLDPPDLLLVTVKAYDTEAAVREAVPLIGPNTAVLSLQNGITTLDILSGTVPEGLLVAGWTSHGATLEKPGAVKHAGVGDTVVGELDGRTTKRIRAISDAFSASGIRTTISTDIRKEVWLKGLVNSAINPLTALARCENGAVAASEGLRRVAKAICDEGAAVARAEGHSITGAEALRRTLRVARQTSANRSSMLRDVEKGRRTEIDFLNGAIADLAARRGLPAPVNGALASIIRGMGGDAGAPRGK